LAKRDFAFGEGRDAIAPPNGFVQA